MKLYASIHGVCGLAEGYSDTTTRFFKTPDEALEHKSRLLDILTQDPHEKVVNQADGLEDIIIINDDEGEHQILKIVEVNPTWDTDNGESEVANNSTPEFLMWNQMDCEVMYDGEYLPTDMGCIKEATDALYGVSESMLMEAWADFVGGIYYQRDTMLDADDVCIHFFRIPKSDTL